LRRRRLVLRKKNIQMSPPVATSRKAPVMTKKSTHSGDIATATGITLAMASMLNQV
jgi:hypothetical protein